MTISASADPTHYTGTGANTALSTVWPFFTATDVVVTQRVTATGAVAVLVSGTHYDVTGGSSTGAVGTVTPIAGATDFTTAMTWTLERNIPLTQALDYAANGIFSAESHEIGLDKLTMQSQDRDATVDRALTFPVTDALALTNILPDSVTRASKVLTFDVNGNATASTLTTVGYGKVLLAETTVSDEATLTVASAGWPVTYDRVELEIVYCVPASESMILIKPIDDGSVVTATLSGTTNVIYNSTSSVTTRSGWSLDPAFDVGITADDWLTGSVVFHSFNGGFMSGVGHFTHRRLTVMYGTTAHFLRHGTAFTSPGGFEFSTETAANLSAKARLWGLPKS